MYFFVIACSFCRITRLPHQGGRPSMLSPRQETLIVDMVRQNNSVKLCEIQQKIIDDHVNFEGITSISISTIDRVLKRNRMRMKQLYRVPFERNSERVKEQRFHYVQVGVQYCCLLYSIRLSYAVQLTKLYVFSHRECFNWIPQNNHMNIFIWMKLGSI